VVGGKTFVWATSSGSIATVASDGVVTAVGVGSVTITATTDGKVGSVALTVIGQVPASLTIVNGNGQSGSVGAFIGPKDPGFRVLDASGAGIAGVSVTFSPSSGGAVSARTVVTDAIGEALVRWQLGPLPTQQTLRADAGSLTATLTASAQANFSILAGNNQSATVGTFIGPNDPAVVLTALNGTAVVGVAVQFTPSGNGVASPSSVTTNAQGLAALRWQLSTTVGSNTLTARVGDSVLTLVGQGRPPVASVSIVGSDGSAIAQPVAAYVAFVSVYVYAQPKDAAGNALSGSTVTWTVSDTSVARADNPSSPVTRIVGVAPGTATLTATSEGKTAGVTILVTLAPVASFSLTMSPTLPRTPVSNTPYLRQGQTVQFTPLLRDVAGNVLTGRTINWSSTNSSVVQISNTGLATGGNDGGTVVSGMVEGVGAVQQLNVVTYHLIVPSTIAVGDSVGARLTNATGGYPCNQGALAAWSSSNSSVVATGPVGSGINGSSSGYVKGLAAGVSTITASCFVGLGQVPANESAMVTVVPKP